MSIDTMPAIDELSLMPISAAPDISLWQRNVPVQYGDVVKAISLTNFLGRNYPTLHNDLMVELFGIRPEDRVIYVGGGDSYFPRADVVTDAFPDSNEHRSGRAVAAEYGHRRFVPCYAESLPFADGEFDFAYCRMVLEHAIDPAAACRELQRIARHGFIETPSPIAEYLGGHPTHRWLVWV